MCTNKTSLSHEQRRRVNTTGNGESKKLPLLSQKLHQHLKLWQGFRFNPRCYILKTHNATVREIHKGTADQNQDKRKIRTPTLGSKTTPSTEIDIRNASRQKQHEAIVIIKHHNTCLADTMFQPLTRLKADTGDVVQTASYFLLFRR